MDYVVRVVFNNGITGEEYAFPLVQNIDDPEPGIKAAVIHGKRANGALIIPGGKESIEITIKGIIFDNNGYEAITKKMSEMRECIHTNPSTLTLKHWDGENWTIDWEFAVRRIGRIIFPESEDKRTQTQPYEVTFLVFSFA